MQSFLTLTRRSLQFWQPDFDFLCAFRFLGMLVGDSKLDGVDLKPLLTSLAWKVCVADIMILGRIFPHFRDSYHSRWSIEVWSAV